MVAYHSIAILCLQFWKEYIGRRKNEVNTSQCNSFLIEPASLVFFFQ